MAVIQDSNSLQLLTGDIQVNTVVHELALMAQAASANAILLRRDLVFAQRRISDLEAEVGAAKSKAASLAEKLADAHKVHTKALEDVRAEAEAKSQKPTGAAEATAVEARTQLADLLDLSAQLEAPPQSHDTQGAQLADEREQPQQQQETSIDFVSPPAEAMRPIQSESNSGDPVNLLEADAYKQMVVAVPEPNAAQESIVKVDGLITNPAVFEGQNIVVTGSIMRLLQHYHLQSNSGYRSLVVEVSGIPPARRKTLQEAIENAGLVGLVRVRITGKVVMVSRALYRIVASDVTLFE